MTATLAPPGVDVARARRRRRLRAAALAAGAVALVALAGLALGLAMAQPSSPASFGAPGLASRSAGPDFRPLTVGEPVPSDVLGVLPVPAAATVVARANLDRSNGFFDRSVIYSDPAPPAAILHFYPAQMAMEGWRILLRSPTEVLAQHASSAGFYWEAGMTLGHRSSGSTLFTLRLVEIEGGD